MGSFYQYSRKLRQLKFRIKLAERIQAGAPDDQQIALCQDLFAEIKKRIQRIGRFPAKYLIRLATLGIFLTLPQLVNGQVFLPPVEQPFNLHQYPSDLGIPIFYNFMDIDHDGDMDCFYPYHDPGNAYYSEDYVSHFMFEENTSNPNLHFSRLDTLLTTQLEFTYEFELADFDNDGDWDIYTAFDSNLIIYENASNNVQLFDIIDTFRLELFDKNFYHLEFADLDLDGDEDLIINTYEYSEYFYHHIEMITFLNNGNSSLQPFDLENPLVEPYNLDVVSTVLAVDSLEDQLYSLGDFAIVDLTGDGKEDFVIESNSVINVEDYNYLFKNDFIVFENVGDTVAHFSEDYEVVHTITRQEPNGNFIFSPISIFSFADIDADGDIDIFENNLNIIYCYDYCYYTYYSKKLFFHENITNEATLVTGSVFLDENSNGIQDTLESGLQDQSILFLPNTTVHTTNSDGKFDFFVSEGNYQLTINTPPSWVSQPQEHNIVATALADTIENINFALQPVSQQQDLRIDAIGGLIRRGFDASYILKIRNLGTTTEDVIVNAIFDEDLDFLSSDPSPTSNSGDQYFWNISQLAPFDTEFINVSTNVSLNTFNGDTLCSVFQITPLADDVARSNNTDTLKQVVIGSYDPNDKLVQPLGSGPEGNVPPETDLFSYTIRFQNTGNDTAFNVIIIDTIDMDLDISTFEMVDVSHPYNFDIDENRRATWIFNDILLPDSSVNNEGSNGYIQYDIQPLANSAVGTQFTNQAHIYFDFNDPVPTNTTLNTFNITLGLLDKELLSYELFPNPSSETAILQFGNPQKEKAIIELYDIHGKLVFEEEIYGDQILLKSKQLPSGLYTFHLKVGDQEGSGKLVFK